MKPIWILIAFLIVNAVESSNITWKPYEFKPDEGDPVNAELGELKVPENRQQKDSRTITLRFVRFSANSKNPGPPIIYLAGGPGGAGTAAAKGTRFPLFMALRELGDVIALDQRAIGLSDPDLGCEEKYQIPFDRPIDPISAGKIFADSTRKCMDQLRSKGIDLSGYNTIESADDLNDLRIALGVPKIRLWGISYGTYLALAAMKRHPKHIDRVILAGVEPLHHTWKLPSDQQKLLQRISDLAANDPKVRATTPDLMVSIRRVLEKLSEKPQSVSLTHPLNGMTANVAVGPFDLQLALVRMLSGPETFAAMPDFIARLEQGDWMALALSSAQARIGQTPYAMTVAMDCASGAGKAWRERINREAKDALLSNAIDFPFPYICEGLDIPDAGDAFREPFESEIPALLISGTLDGRTPVSNGEEAARQLKNHQHLIIENAGHSDPLFLSSPKILEAMKSFLRGEKIKELRIQSQQPVSFLPPRKIVSLSETLLSKYAGEYKIKENDVRQVIKAGTLLYTKRGEGEPRPIRPMSDTRFFYEASATWLQFDMDDKGNVTGMTVFQEGAEPGEPAVKVK